MQMLPLSYFPFNAFNAALLCQRAVLCPTLLCIERDLCGKVGISSIKAAFKRQFSHLMERYNYDTSETADTSMLKCLNRVELKVTLNTSTILMQLLIEFDLAFASVERIGWQIRSLVLYVVPERNACFLLRGVGCRKKESIEHTTQGIS